MIWLLLGCVQRAERLDQPQQLLTRLQAGDGPPVELPVLGPAGRELRALEMQRAERPEEAFEGLAGFDPGAVDAAWRFERGDPTTRLLLAEALRRELERPTLPASATWTGLGERGERLRVAARAGLLQDPRLAVELEEGESDALLLELLEREPDGFGEAAVLEVTWPAEAPALDAAWEARLEGRVQPELLREAAAWLPEGDSKALLGLVASPVHAYGEGPSSAGQRGEPADVLRYGGGTPGATAVTALALAEARGVELDLYGDGRKVLLASGGLRAWVGPCGPGAAPSPEPLLRPLGVDEAQAWAAAERVAGAMEAGEVERAVSLSRDLDGLEPPESYRSVHGALLACQGVVWPGLTEAEAELALAWASACPDGAAQALRERFPGLEPYDGLGIDSCHRPWKPLARAILKVDEDGSRPSE